LSSFKRILWAGTRRHGSVVPSLLETRADLDETEERLASADAGIVLASPTIRIPEHSIAATKGTHWIGPELRKRIRSRPPKLQCERLPHLAAPESAIDDFVKKTKEVGKINPKSAIQAASVETTIHHCIVPLHHHEAFTFEAMHRRP
jgi:hypothetical protein